MDEKQWLSCGDARPMLEHLADKISERKLRLFSCACCRRIWHVMSDPRCRRAIEVAEQLADGVASPFELANARSQVANAHDEAYDAAYREEFDVYPYTEKITPVNGRVQSSAAALAAVSGTPRDRFADECGRRCTFAAAAAVEFDFLTSVPQGSVLDLDGIDHTINNNAELSERAHQADLLREIVGDPFHPVTVSTTWLDWNNCVVVRLAQYLYDNPHLPSGTLNEVYLAILADALEEAGCNIEQILTHLRSNIVHTRGCFVVDLLLGKS